jgi:hypothetical protein
MSTDITVNNLTATIPALGDSANIVTAFTSYHTDIANGVAILDRANTFGGASGRTQTLKTASGGSLEISTVNASKNGMSIIATDATGFPIRFRPILAGTSMSSSEFYYDGTNDRWVSEVPLLSEIRARTGTNTLAPVTFTSGTVLDTPAAGVMEYNGQFFLTNNTTTKRGVVSPKHIYSLTSTRSLSTSAGSQSLFGVGLSLEANTVYEFDIWFALTSQTSVSGSSTTIQLSLALPTSSTGSYEAAYSASTSSTSASRTLASITATPLTSGTVTYSGTSSTATGQYHMKGVIRTSSSGTFTPNLVVVNGTNALSSLTLSAGSYATVNKVGAANANIITGDWV